MDLMSRNSSSVHLFFPQQITSLFSQDQSVLLLCITDSLFVISLDLHIPSLILILVKYNMIRAFEIKPVLPWLEDRQAVRHGSLMR